MAWHKMTAALVIISLCLVPLAHAHHLWVMKAKEGYMVARGHAPAKTQEYDPSSVKEVNAFDREGNPIMLTKKKMTESVILHAEDQVEEDIALITVRCDWGYRVITTQGKKLMAKQEAEKAGFTVVESFFSTQFSKSFFTSGAGNTKATGLPFEIIPLDDPLQFPHGEQLPVQLIFRGHPLENAVIISADGEETKTDKRGLAKLKISSESMQLFSTRHKVPEENNPDKDHHLYTTFLTFEVKK